MIFHTGVQEYQAQYYANNLTGQKEKQNLLTEHSNQIFLAEDIWEYYMSSHAALTCHTLVDNSILIKQSLDFIFKLYAHVWVHVHLYIAAIVWMDLPIWYLNSSHWKVNKVRLSSIWLMTQKKPTQD